MVSRVTANRHKSCLNYSDYSKANGIFRGGLVIAMGSIEVGKG